MKSLDYSFLPIEKYEVRYQAFKLENGCLVEFSPKCKIISSDRERCILNAHEHLSYVNLEFPFAVIEMHYPQSYYKRNGDLPF